NVPSPDVTVDWCSSCGLCTTACPADVKIAEINSRARAEMKARHRARFRDWLLGQTDLVGRMGVAFAPIANWTLHNRPIRWLIEKVVGIHRSAPLPLFAGRTLGAELKRSGEGIRGADPADEPPPDRAVVYFHGCAANYYEPRVALAAIEVLRRNGFETIVPEQVCCGLPLISNGLYDHARRRAQGNLPRLADYARRGYRIVGTSTSCTLTIKEEAPDLLDEHDEDSRLVGSHTYDIHEFLLDLAARGELTGWREIPMRLPYHPPCQYRAHRLGIPAREVLDLVPGLEVVESGAACCGIAGTYGYKEEKYRIAMDVGRPLFEFVEREGAPVVACDSETCRWQITHGTGVDSIHPLEVVAASLGVEVEGPLAVALREVFAARG
ncbi:MAG TPA: anaerobic glycerol-3-phosphate dehydrogenase subunit C, partial [Acidimicrobiia bacterium]|nr:anaerobic glycerol-3-phosphate dehydrogenase subunit C [Acidimicrobiia bacterium]